MKDNLNISYPATIAEEKQDDGTVCYVVSFRDLDGCNTYGNNYEEAKAMAKEALDLLLECMLTDNDEIPKPSTRKTAEVSIYPSPKIAVPLLLKLAREEQNKTITNIASSLDVPYQNYQMLEKGKRKNVTISTLTKAFNALGYEAEIVLHKI